MGFARLRKLHIRNFRHFREESVAIDPHVTVLVGANDTGKSSLLGALVMLRDAIRDGSGEPVAEWDAGADGGPATQLAIDFDCVGHRWSYEVATGRRPREVLRRSTPGATAEWTLDRGSRRLTVEDATVQGSPLSLGVRGGTLKRALSEATFAGGVGDDDWKLSPAGLALTFLATALPEVRHLHPRWLAAPSDGAADPVSPDGGGFAASLQRVINRRDGSIETIEALLLPMFPHLARVRVHSGDEGDRRLEVRFTVRHGNAEVDVPASNASAGLLLALAHLTLSFDTARSSVLAIEEPENGLNARIMLQLMRAFLDTTQSRGQQVILTTHNGWWLDVVSPEAIRVISRDAVGGHVHAPNLAALEHAREKQDAYPSEIFATFGPEGLLRVVEPK